jgi:hypothetical protein
MLAMLDLIRAVCWAISISFSLRECNEWLHLQLPMQHARANDAYALSFVHVPPEGAGKGKGKRDHPLTDRDGAS